MSFIETYLAKAINETVESGVDWCVTLESKRDGNKWIQLTAHYINLYYPFSESPDEALQSLPMPECEIELESFEPGTFITYEHGADKLQELANFVNVYARLFLNEEPAVENWDVTEQAL